MRCMMDEPRSGGEALFGHAGNRHHCDLPDGCFCPPTLVFPFVGWMKSVVTTLFCRSREQRRMLSFRRTPYYPSTQGTNGTEITPGFSSTSYTSRRQGSRAKQSRPHFLFHFFIISLYLPFLRLTRFFLVSPSTTNSRKANQSHLSGSNFPLIPSTSCTRVVSIAVIDHLTVVHLTALSSTAPLAY